MRIGFRRDSSTPAMGTHTSTRVPLPACDSMENWPWTNRARSLMLTRPSEPLARIAFGSKPTPSSAMVRRSSPPALASSTLAAIAPLWLTTLCKGRWTGRRF